MKAIVLVDIKRTSWSEGKQCYNFIFSFWSYLILKCIYHNYFFPRSSFPCLLRQRCYLLFWEFKFALWIICALQLYLETLYTIIFSFCHTVAFVEESCSCITGYKKQVLSQKTLANILKYNFVLSFSSSIVFGLQCRQCYHCCFWPSIFLLNFLTVYINVKLTEEHNWCYLHRYECFLNG